VLYGYDVGINIFLQAIGVVVQPQQGAGTSP
jgi:hypothetical protein